MPMESEDKQPGTQQGNYTERENIERILTKTRKSYFQIETIDGYPQTMKSGVDVLVAQVDLTDAQIDRFLEVKLGRPTQRAQHYSDSIEDILKTRREMDAESEKRIRRRMIERGEGYRDMDAEEWALFHETQSINHVKDVVNKLTNNSVDLISNKNGMKLMLSEPHSLVPTDLTPAVDYLISLGDELRFTFGKWCVLKEYIPLVKHMDEFVEHQKNMNSLTSTGSSGPQALAAHSGFGNNEKEEARQRLKDSGWEDDDIDNLNEQQFKDIEKGEKEQEAISTPHFKRKSNRYTRVIIRDAQKEFRSRVLANWGYRCAISGSTLVVEACHIIPFSEDGPDCVENGIALAVDFHRLMDSGHLIIKNNKVILSDEALKEPRYKQYHDYVLKPSLVPVNFPSQPDYPED